MVSGSATFTSPARLSDSIISLVDYCRRSDWAGFDPYDALNSTLFARTPLSRSRIARIVLTQSMKRLPINIRPLLQIRRAQNPKAIALFLMAVGKLGACGAIEADALVPELIDRLKSLRAQNTAYWCWGYSFPWQTRSELVPRWAPNIVCTTFVANALLDVYEATSNSACLDIARSACDYLLDELYWTDGNAEAGFAYPVPGVKSRVHNANFLGAAVLCRVYRYCGDTRLLHSALKVARYSASRQRGDGSWDYGELSTQRWVDNFHTGYNLCALRSISQYIETAEFDACLSRGFSFYRAHFFTSDGAPKYFHDRIYPIDIHSSAQSIITLLTLRDLGEGSAAAALGVYDWTMRHMWDSRGYFYYQALPYMTNKIPYIRWSQAWMLLALATIAYESSPRSCARASANARMA